MAKFLISVSYTAEGAKGLREEGGSKRRQVATNAVESLGGKMEAFYYSFGEQDVICIVDMPDAIAAAALSVAISASGGATIKTTPLLTVEDMDHASQKKSAYRAPGA